MFFSCPHCRELVAIDRETRLPPTMCPRCGGVLREESSDTGTASTSSKTPSASGSLSFVSFLRNGELHNDESATQAEAAPVSDPAEASDELVVETPEPRDAVSTIERVDTAEPALSEVAAVDAPVELAITAPAPESDAAAEPEAPAKAAATVKVEPLLATPSFTRQSARPSLPARTARWQWAAVVVLALALAIQVLVADRNTLAADAGWRPLIARICATLGCSIPAWHQPGAFTMLSRDVSPMRGVAGGLQVQASFRNDARWAQPWPVLVLSLSDADGRTVGERAFTSSEYLGAAATQKELGAGQSAQIALQLHEPNPDVVAFSFDFR